MSDTLYAPVADQENDTEAPGLGQPPPAAPLDVPAPAAAPPPDQDIKPQPGAYQAVQAASAKPDDPWASVFASKSDDPWASVFQQPVQAQQPPADLGETPMPGPETVSAIKNIGNAFVRGLGDGWTGASPLPGLDHFGLGPESAKDLRQWTSYPGVEKEQRTVWQAFNEAFVFPAVRGLAEAAAFNAQVGASVAAVPLQAGAAVFRGATEAIREGVEQVSPQSGAARAVAGMVETGAILLGGAARIPRAADYARAPMPEGVGVPETRIPVEPEPHPAVTAFRQEPFPETPGGTEVRRTTPITPDIIQTAKEQGILGTTAEWDGTSVYSAARGEDVAGPIDVHGVARQIDPATFEEYDRLSAMRDNARQTLQDETERLRSNAEEQIEANAPHTDEIADLRETLADPRSSARSKRNAEARLPDLVREQEAYLADQDRFEFLTRETPEVTDLRREVMANDERMRDLAPQVSAAYREAERRMPAEPVPEPVAEEPVPQTPETPVETPETPTVATSPASVPTEPPLDIAAHVTDRLTRAGRPDDEAAAMGALAQAYYETKAARFGGRKGTAADLYRAEAPQIVGREARGNASGMLERVNGKSVLTLFRRADPTTVIHEFGHQWFNDLLRDAGDKDAPGALRVDAETVRRWLGVEDGAELTRRHQERVARAFERYMMEGHAPSTGLARVFEQFKDWMAKVYETVRQQKIEINDDLRGVFDRWFSTEPRERAVVAPEPAGPPPRPRELGQIMRDERVRESVAKQIQANELIAYSEWQAANRNGGTNAAPAPAGPTAPGERPRTPRPIAQIIAEDKVGPAKAAQIQGEEYIALSEWQATQRAAGKSTTPERGPLPPMSMDATAIAKEMLKPKEMPEAAPVEPVTATPPEPVASPVGEPEPVVAKNFGPAAKDVRSPAYVKVPREPRRLAQFMKEGITLDKGTAAERIAMRGLMPEPGNLQQLQSVLNGKKGIINLRDGEPLDHARERAVEAKYLPEDSDINDLYNALDEDTSGTPKYSQYDDAKVYEYERAVQHNREIDRLAAEHGIDPRGMTLHAFTKAIEDKVGKEEFDAKALIERARAIDEANEMRDDLTHWEDSEAEHADRLRPDEFERLWGEASASQELVDRGPGDEQPGVSGGPAGQGAEGAGSERGGTGATGSATGEGKPEPTPVTEPGDTLSENLKRRRDEIPKIANVRLEYIDQERWDDLARDVAGELSLSGDPRVTEGSVKAMTLHAINNAALEGWDLAKQAWQKAPTPDNLIEVERAKGRAAAAFENLSVGLTDWGKTGNQWQKIIRASKRRIAEIAAGNPDDMTLFQRQVDIALKDELNTPEQVGKALRDDYLTTWDKARKGLMAFYVNSILSGPVTHGGYLLGNMVYNAARGAVLIPAQAAVGLIRTTTMDRVMFGEMPAHFFGMANGAMKGFAPAWRALKTGDLMMEGLGDKPLIHDQAILPTLLGGSVGKVLETPSRVVAAIHVLNYSMAYTAEISRLAYRAASAELAGKPVGFSEFGAAMQRFMNNVPEDAMAFAHDEAIRSVLMKRAPFGTTQAHVAAAINNNLFLKILAPFPQIGMNLAEEGLVRLTPLGLASKTVRSQFAAGGAQFDIAAGRMLAGTGVAVAAVTAALNGLITGSGPDQSAPDGRAKARLLEDQGWAPYSARFGDVYVPYQKALGGLGELIGMSATMADAGRAMNEGELKEAATRLAHGFEHVVVDETWFRGMHDFLEAVNNPETRMPTYLRNLTTSFMPFSQLLAQSARQIDPNRREIHSLLDAAQSKIPVASESMHPVIGPWGQPVLSHSTMGPHRLQNDPVNQRMIELGMGVKPFERKIKGVELDGDEYEKYGRLAGTLAHQMLLPMVTAQGFSDMPRGMQMKQIEQRIHIAREHAEKVIQAENPEKFISGGLAIKQQMLMQGRGSPGTYLH